MRWFINTTSAFEKLISDDSKDALTAQKTFLAAVNETLARQSAKYIGTMICKAPCPVPQANIDEIRYDLGRNLIPPA